VVIKDDCFKKVTALEKMWPDMKFVHGRARHPQSQGSVERANADIKKMLATWMRENRSIKWSIGCKFVQLKKNHTLHSACKCSPYKATFGIDTPLGLQSTVIPSTEWAKLETAKDLFELVAHVPKVGDEVPDEDESDELTEDNVFNPEEYEISDLIRNNTTPNDSQPLQQATTSTAVNNEQDYERRANELMGVREDVRLGQSKQADRMLGRSAGYLSDVKIGDYVKLAVDDVDRGLTDPPNIICRIIDIDWDRSLYELACGAGVLSTKFARNAFDHHNSELSVPIRTDVALRVREAVRELSIGGGQGFIKCNCTRNCQSNVCKCKKNNVLCNSRCHAGNNICENK
jgi:hypothetical protein